MQLNFNLTLTCCTHMCFVLSFTSKGLELKGICMYILYTSFPSLACLIVPRIQSLPF